ncbi:MAG: hypothetical protein JST70_12590 [Bacteroidetes bacterium]|nr:hypothetical protein [Bacteroidota bacterium]
MDLRIVKDDIFIYDDVSDDTNLREDMYQAVYGQYIIDCGWYETEDGGNFITYLIKDNNWETPVIKIIIRTLHDAKWSIKACKTYLSEV